MNGGQLFAALCYTVSAHVVAGGRAFGGGCRGIGRVNDPARVPIRQRTRAWRAAPCLFCALYLGMEGPQNMVGAKQCT